LVLPFILALCLCGAFCLAPLAMYLMWLSRVTRRETPTAVSGPWDFVGVMIALSGFVVVGGGVLLNLFQSNFRYWMRGNAEAFRAAWVEERVTWTLFVVFYLLVVLGCAGFTLLSRRRTLVVYNVEPAAFEAVLREAFEQLGLPIERRGKLWVGRGPVCEVDTFAAGRTVTLRWLADDAHLFEDVNRLVRAGLPAVATEENSVTTWLNAVAVGAGVAAISSLGLLVYGLALMGR